MSSIGLPISGLAGPPRVSVVTIFLNQEDYLQEAIASVVAQTFSDWELLLVDDGSIDSSGELARAACAADPRVRYLTHSGGGNRGMSASRNLGISQAAGELIAFLDGDDCWVGDKLERQVAILDRHTEAVMVCGASIHWYSWNGGQDVLVRVGANRRSTFAVDLLPQDRLVDTTTLLKNLYPLGLGQTPSMSGTTVRTNVLRSVGGFEERFTGLFEDQVFRARMFLAGPVYVASRVFDYYRRHDRSTTASARGSPSADRARNDFLKWLGELLGSRGRMDFELRVRLAAAKLRTKNPRRALYLRRALPALRLADRLLGNKGYRRTAGDLPERSG